MLISLTPGLDGLCSQEKLDLLNAADALRSQGISHYVSLPQIIVCGDQSSGKSSVLEAISGVPFPVKSNVCTRFPTELVLRKDPATVVKVSIIPHQSRSQSERDVLSGFTEKLDDLQQLPGIIERATAAMGISTMGKAFSNDLLRIEISGPDRPHLTIVDLPGLIHSETKNQTATDVQLVKDMVEGYMKSPRSIVLAVVSAKNDYANQIVLKLARSADPDGDRTLGVITKPDTLIPGSGTEKTFVSLAMNEDIEFSLGWHVLKNGDSEAGNWTLDERNALEAEFLSTSAWSALSETDRGIETLRTKLSNLLVRQIKSELPNLMTEIARKTAVCQTQLDRLGEARVTTDQQRVYLTKISQAFQSIVKAAVDGTYNDPFFRDAESTVGYEKRVRAVIQNLNTGFAGSLSSDGKLLELCEEDEEELLEEGEEDLVDPDRVITRKAYLDKIVSLMERSRGRELPGMFNPMIITDLFKEQSRPWDSLTQHHLRAVWAAARDFMGHVLDEITDASTVESIQKSLVEPDLDDLLSKMIEGVKILIKQHQESHPITYHDDLTTAVWDARSKTNLKDSISHAIRSYFAISPGKSLSSSTSRSVDLQCLVDRLVLELKPGTTTRLAASDALNCVEAYYEVAMKRFVDDVCVAIIETGLVSQLGSIMSPIRVATMSAEELDRIAGEKASTRKTREQLQAKLAALRSGTEICKELVGGGSPGISLNSVGDTEKAVSQLRL